MTQQRSDALAGRRILTGALVAVPALVLSPGGTEAQVRPDPPPVSAVGDTVTVVPAAQYDASAFHRHFLGPGWREVWITPVDVEVFDFDTYGGGVDWERRGGGNQSITLHLEARDDWREYIFRSVNKFPNQALPDPLVNTVVGDMIGDLISSTFPAAPLMVPPLLEALDILHVEPVLRIMPDDPRLEVYQDTFAGMLGTVELKPNEGPDDTPGFAGSEKIKGTEEFMNDLEESKEHRLDEWEFLEARLVDFLINDTDRSRDNMRWVRYGEEGDYRWRPLPIDRDWAFLDAGGWLGSIAGDIYPKFADFGPNYPSVNALTYTSHLLDRELLQRLTRDDFVATADRVSRLITDDVIEASIARMPDRWQTGTGAPAWIRESLRGRRAQLEDIALQFYDYLATDVDIHATDEPDLAIVERHGDGRVTVLMTWPEGHARSGEPFFQRTFLPRETSEVRVFLRGDDDVARVVGAASGPIRVRLIGGGGDDRLVDEAGGGDTYLYDARGDNELVPGSGTHMSTREWDAPAATEGLRAGGSWAPDWGDRSGWSPTVDYGDRAGLVIGLGRTWTQFGFRRLPHHWSLGARLLYSFGAGGLGAEVAGDYRFENSPLALTLAARGTTFEAFRFNGYGNDSPDTGESGLVSQDRVMIAPALRWHIGWRARETDEFLVGEARRGEGGAEIRPLVGALDFGPTFIWSDAETAPEAPITTLAPLGTGSLARSGLRMTVELDKTDRDGVPRRGWRLNAAAAGYPGLLDLPDPFAEMGAEAAAYLPLLGSGPHLAVRGGGTTVTGTIPVQHTPFVGGRTTLRGYDWERFRGDAAAYGSAELRAPVMPVEILIRWNMGVFALGDAGRVWVGAESPGGWHTAYGAGLWLEALDNVISAAWARGESHRFYLQMSTFF